MYSRYKVSSLPWGPFSDESMAKASKGTEKFFFALLPGTLRDLRFDRFSRKLPS